MVQRNTVRETKRYAGHTEKVSGLNELKNLATREKLEVWGINSTLGIYQIAVYLWNSVKGHTVSNLHLVQRNTVRETKRYAGHTEKVSGLNELKNLATREKLEVWGINSTLGIYQIAVYLWNSVKGHTVSNLHLTN